MGVINVSSKSELSSLSNQLSKHTTQLKGEIDGLKSVLSSVSNYDGIDVVGAGSILSSNLTNVLTDMETISQNIMNYVEGLVNFDVYDLDSDSLLNEDVKDDNTLDLPNIPLGNDVTNGKDTTSSKPQNFYGTTGTGGTVGGTTSQPTTTQKNETSNDDVVNSIVNNGITNNQVSHSVENGSNSVVDIPLVDDTVSDGQVSDNDVLNSDILLDDSVSDDVFISNESGYIGQMNNNVSSTDNNNNNSSIIPGILTGLGAAAVVGAGVVGGVKTVKRMKENQEVDEEEDDDDDI